MKHNSPSNQVIGMAKTKFPTQESSNIRFLNGKRPYSPWNQDKSSQEPNSTKGADSSSNEAIQITSTNHLPCQQGKQAKSILNEHEQSSDLSLGHSIDTINWKSCDLLSYAISKAQKEEHVI
jgi:hypothetical protein